MVEIEVSRNEKIIEKIELAPGETELVVMPKKTLLGLIEVSAAENGTDFTLRRPIPNAKETRYEAGTHASSLTINYPDGKVIKISTGTPSYRK